MRRELEIALRARVTWIVAAIVALLVGHGFILAVDLFSAASRSALASALQIREMDPLAGIVRPTLGGVDLALVLLAPLIAARPLAIEKERRTFGALCLAAGSPLSVLMQKLLAAVAASAPFLAAPIVLLAAFRMMGGHIDGPETTVAFAGSVFRALLVTAACMAGAAWAQTFAQAVTIGIAVSLSSWAIDAADGFAALAWLGGASAWSIERKLIPFQRGIVPLGSGLWLLTIGLVALALAWVGASFDLSIRRKLGLGLVVVVAGTLVASAAGHIRRGFDWTEARRASLPPAVVSGLRELPGNIEIDVYYDRDDSRRRQLEGDVFEKLLLARPDITIRAPLDEVVDVTEAQRDATYGRVVIQAGGGTRESRSTSRRELVTLIFEAAGRALPDYSQPVYAGYPVVIDGARRGWLAVLAYAIIPLILVGIGWRLSQGRTAR